MLKYLAIQFLSAGPFSTHQDDITDCMPCPAGYYCDQRGATEPTGQCSPGHVCFGSALIPDPIFNDDPTGNKTIIDFGDQCRSGHYCPAGSSNMIGCPRGTYNPDRGKSDLSSCLPCDPGYYCDGTNLTAPTGKVGLEINIGQLTANSFFFDLIVNWQPN